VAEHFGAASTSCAVLVGELLCIVSTGSLEKYYPFQDEFFSLSFRQTGNAHPSTGNGQCSYRICRGGADYHVSVLCLQLHD
jgi:hypothetical protein